MNLSLIGWTDITFNPWIGCREVSPGCQFCYAREMDRFRGWTAEGWGKGKPRKRTSELGWNSIKILNRRAREGSFVECEGCGKREIRKTSQQTGNLEICSNIECDSPRDFRPVRPRVFCASLSDWLDEEVPCEWLIDLMELIRLSPDIDWQLLTKRTNFWRERLNSASSAYTEDGEATSRFSELAPTRDWLHDWFTHSIAPEHIWIGATVENQKMANQRVPELCRIPAHLRFVSCEPLLEQVNLNSGAIQKSLDQDQFQQGGIHWIICGGESESKEKARPFNLNWARSLRKQSSFLGAQFFMKQMGRNPFCGNEKITAKDRKGANINEFPEDLKTQEFPIMKSWNMN